MSVIIRPSAQPKINGWRRYVSIVLGLFFVGMAYLGAILPGLPTTPFVLLASYCFSRSSPRLQRWLHRTPYFGHLLRDWETHRGLRKPVKWMATCIMVPVVSISICFTPLPWWVKIVIGSLALCGLATIWLILPTVRLPHVDNEPNQPDGRAKSNMQSDEPTAIG